jgi:perosamine synthetase
MMAGRKIPFHIPSIGEEEISEVVDSLRSGWLTTGPKVKKFEQAFADYVGTRSAIAVNSCTSALHLALEAIAVKAGDEVVVPAYTFTGTAAVVTHCGARPVLADSRPGGFNVEAASIEPVITPRTRALVVVHFAGEACDMDPILDLAARHGLPVVEDAAHALPTTYKNRMVGTIGDLTAFSFYATKTITTGEGGMLTTAREDWEARIRKMGLHGMSTDAWKRYAPGGSWYYEVEDFGFKYNMTDLSAALGIQQLRRVDEFQKRRQAIAGAYAEALGSLDACIVPRESPYGVHAWHLFPLQLNLESLRAGRAEFIRELGDRGVSTSVHFIPLHHHPAYQRAFGYHPGDFPSADLAFSRIVSLPIYPAMSDADVGRVIEAVSDTAAALRR